MISCVQPIVLKLFLASFETSVARVLLAHLQNPQESEFVTETKNEFYVS